MQFVLLGSKLYNKHGLFEGLKVIPRKLKYLSLFKHNVYLNLISGSLSHIEFLICNIKN